MAKQLLIGLLGIVAFSAFPALAAEPEQGKEVALGPNAHRTNWWLTVKPGKDELILATYREVPGVVVVEETSPDRVRVERMIYAPSGNYTEHLSHLVAGKYVSGKERSFEGAQMVSGFGQMFRVKDLALGGTSGSSAVVSYNGEGEATRTARRRFSFVDNDKKSRVDLLVVVEYSLQVISRDEAERRLGFTGLKLPVMGENGWSITIPPHLEELKALEEKAK